jgi:hypothetical protein
MYRITDYPSMVVGKIYQIPKDRSALKDVYQTPKKKTNAGDFASILRKEMQKVK